MTTLPIADVSSWQGAINYPLLKSKTQGVILRAGNGLFTDPKFALNYSVLIGHPVGAYWFVQSNVSVAAQIDKFLAAISGKSLPLGLVMDAELNAGNLSQSALRNFYAAFLSALHSARPDDRLVIYTRASYWNPAVGVAGWEKQYPLWVAHYGVTDPAIPLAWQGADYWLHQYSADGNNLGDDYGVSSDDIDLNKPGPTFEPDPDPLPVPPPGDCEPQLLAVQTEKVNIRAGAGTQYEDLGDYFKGDKVPVYKTVPVSASSVWAKIDPEPESVRHVAIVHAGVLYLK